MKNEEKKSVAESRLKTLAPYLLVVIVSCAMSFYYLLCNPDHLLIFDDSYITLKFAAHFFDFRGITYDGSSYLTGATSPLHIILVAILGLFLKMEIASLVIGISFFIFSSLIVYSWTFKIYNDRRVALVAGIILSTNGWLIYDSLNGLETTTFICFSLLTFYSYYCFPSKPLYILPLLLSILTRPEGWFIMCSLWGWQLMQFILQRDKKILKDLLLSIGIFSLAIIPYLLLFHYFTGSPLPSTALAKAVFFAESDFQLSIKFKFLKDGIIFFHKSIYPYPWFIFPLVLFARRVITLPYLWFYYIVFYLFYFFFFPGAISHYWYRYQHIFLPLLIMGIVGGAYELIMMSKGKKLRFLVAACVVVAVVYNQSKPFVNIKNLYTASIESTQKPIINLAQWLKHNTPKDALIALHDIGVVGYFSERRILDLVGIINPEISKHYRNEQPGTALSFSERNIINYLKEKEPDYLVMFPEWDRFFNLLQTTNKKYFQFIHTTPPLFPTEMRYNVYKCDWTP